MWMHYRSGKGEQVYVDALQEVGRVSRCMWMHYRPMAGVAPLVYQTGPLTVLQRSTCL
ncbi:hypothetical protein LEMLEM_LOCUS807, partial [Lemmus lemmus]